MKKLKTTTRPSELFNWELRARSERLFPVSGARLYNAPKWRKF
jgi:hypothetical protein